MAAPVPLAQRDLRDGIGEAVAQVHARAGRAVASEQRPDAGARLRPAVPRDARRELGILGTPHQVGAPGLRAQPLEAGRRRAELTRDVHRVAGLRAAPLQDLSRLHAADERDVEDERPRRARDVAAGQRDVGRGGELGQAVEQAVHVFDERVGRQHEREQREPRGAAHRRHVADVDGERLVPDVGWRGEASIEVDPFDERVRRQHLQRTPIRRRDRRIVSDADEELGWSRGQAAADPFNQCALAGVGDARASAATGQTQRRGSP